MKVYYHNDFDGRCGAAIVRWMTVGLKKLEAMFGNKVLNTPEIPYYEFIELDYKDEVKVENIKKDELVLIIDFSFKPEVMAKVLERTEYVVWFDHHKTSLEYDYGRILNGLRDEKFAGCELVWKYLVAKEAIPKGVQLIGDYDIWAFRYGKLTEDYHMGLQLYNTYPESDVWKNLVFTDDEKAINLVANEGKICKKFRENFCADYVKSFGFETEFDGYKAFALGLACFGSKGFGKLIKNYPLCLSFEFDGENWIIGLYSETLDVGKIAVEAGKKYGALSAGGHKGAAGMVLRELTLTFKGKQNA